MSYSPELEAVLEVAGGPTALSKKLGIGASAVTNWRHVPAKHLHKVASITGIPVEKIRADLMPAVSATA